MRRRVFLAALAGTASVGGCLGRDPEPSGTTSPTKGGATPTSVRHTADGVAATFRVVDGRVPTDDTAEATFEDDGATVTGTMDPGGCRRPTFGSVSYDATDEVAHLLVDTASPYGPEATVECGNASYDYRCVLAVERGGLSAVEVVHGYDGKENRSFDLVEG